MICAMTCGDGKSTIQMATPPLNNIRFISRFPFFFFPFIFFLSFSFLFSLLILFTLSVFSFVSFFFYFCCFVLFYLFVCFAISVKVFQKCKLSETVHWLHLDKTKPHSACFLMCNLRKNKVSKKLKNNLYGWFFVK